MATNKHPPVEDDFGVEDFPQDFAIHEEGFEPMPDHTRGAAHHDLEDEEGFPVHSEEEESESHAHHVGDEHVVDDEMKDIGDEKVDGNGASLPKPNKWIVPAGCAGLAAFAIGVVWQMGFIGGNAPVQTVDAAPAFAPSTPAPNVVPRGPVAPTTRPTGAVPSFPDASPQPAQPAQPVGRPTLPLQAGQPSVMTVRPSAPLLPQQASIAPVEVQTASPPPHPDAMPSGIESSMNNLVDELKGINKGMTDGQAKVTEKLGQMDGKLGGLDTHFGQVEAKIGGMDQRIAALEAARLAVPVSVAAPSVSGTGGVKMPIPPAVPAIPPSSVHAPTGSAAPAPIFSGGVNRHAREVERRAERRERRERHENAAASPVRTHDAAPAREVVAPTPALPLDLGAYSLRGVSREAAMVMTPSGLVKVDIGKTLPGVGVVKEIRPENGNWVLVTSGGIIKPSGT